jgi:hypothetical protein
MKCREIEPLIYLVREGETTDEEKEKIAEHIATCVNCKKIYESVLRMTRIVKQISYDGGAAEKPELDAGQIIQRAGETRKAPSDIILRYLPLIKGVAASLLILFASTLLYQEAEFHKYRAAMHIPEQQVSPVYSNIPAEEDCLKVLTRRYRIRTFGFLRQDNSAVMNGMSEEQISQFIEQVCGSDAGDISRVKKLLMQAGLIKTNQLN